MHKFSAKYALHVYIIMRKLNRIFFLLINLSLVQGIFLFSLVNYKPVTYNKTYEYPSWAVFIGWCMALSSMLCIPVYFVYQLLVTPGNLRQVIFSLKYIVT